MPRRTLLSSEQRVRLFGIATETAEMAKHYVLSAEDLALVRAKRRPNNRLGFAVQLCALRHPGSPLESSEVPPTAMLAFVANQVGADPKLFGDYVWRRAMMIGPTRDQGHFRRTFAETEEPVRRTLRETQRKLAETDARSCGLTHIR